MKQIIEKIEFYYTSKFETHGETPQGVDWNGIASQEKRFEVLCKVFENKTGFSLLDFGCGYGSLIDYLIDKKIDCKYCGFDISEKMVSKAQKRHPETNTIKWKSELPDEKFDFVLASGIFNVKLDVSEKKWLEYIFETLIKFNKLSSMGFSFNALTSYSDPEYKKDYLFYSNPLVLFDFCKKNFSNNIALLHDYNMFDFTILVKKNG